MLNDQYFSYIKEEKSSQIYYKQKKTIYIVIKGGMSQPGQRHLSVTEKSRDGKVGYGRNI